MKWLQVIAVVGIMVSGIGYASDPYEGASASLEGDEYPQPSAPPKKQLYPDLSEYEKQSTHTKYVPTDYSILREGNGDLTDEEALKIAEQESSQEAQEAKKKQEKEDKKLAQQWQEEENRRYAQHSTSSHRSSEDNGSSSYTYRPTIGGSTEQLTKQQKRAIKRQRALEEARKQQKKDRKIAERLQQKEHQRDTRIPYHPQDDDDNRWFIMKIIIWLCNLLGKV